MKHKDNIKFIKNHKIICCAKPEELEEEISILEQTIEELTEETQAKNKFIDKQNTENSMLMREALRVESTHGRNLSRMLTRQNKDCVIESIIKPDAHDKDIIQTAISSAKKLCKQDVVIIWTSEPHIILIDEFIMKMEHTNPIVLTKPYLYGTDKYKNSEIYRDNLSFFKELHLRKIQKQHVIECNTVLRRSNYSRNGKYIKDIGKWHLAKVINRHIQEKFGEVSVKDEPISNNTQPYDFQQEIPIPVTMRDERNRLSIEEELQIFQAETTEKTINTRDEIDSVPKDNTNNFLYPRLSQIQLSQK
ncbi:hypothetical protein JTB14_006409 [Gonioctena quinquepunctata]|nr:hypothetical protein JTB14_006409 [Gonioctena quinquepunctata]